MQAVTIGSHGGPEVVSLQELSKPPCKPGHALVQIHCAALNHLDLFVRQGWPGLKLNFPHVLGSDGCGKVAEIGPNSGSTFKEGDSVILNPTLGCGKCGSCNKGENNLCTSFCMIGEQVNGTYAEFISMPLENLALLPSHLDPEEGAALPLTFVTAWRMLVTLANIKKDETLLIQGIGGGVAMACLQLGQAMGCRILVTSRSQAKLDRAISLGAEKGFLSTDTEMTRLISKYTDRQGVDVVMDCVGAATWKKSLSCLRRGGRLLTCGATTGPNPETDINRIFWNHLTIYGSTMGSRKDFADMVQFVSEKKIKPVVDRVFPFNQASEALLYLEKAKQLGKVVLQVQ